MNNEESISCLDGLRGIAVLIVVASHYGHAKMNLIPYINLIGIGQFGVYIFFFLSWFLLSRQFYRGKEITIKYIISYLIKRVFRIIPLYYIVLIVDFYILKVDFPQSNINDLYACMLLKEAPGVFWTIPIEMKSYLLLPIIAILFKKLSTSKNGNIIIAIMSLIMLVLNIYFQSTSILGTLGIDRYYTCFLAGAVAALVYEKMNGIKFNSNVIFKVIQIGCIITLITQIPIVWIKITGSPSSVYEIDWNNFYQYRYLLGVFVIPVGVLSILLSNKVFTRKVLSSRILRGIGKISFSVYLIHYSIITIMQNEFSRLSQSLKSPIIFLIIIMFSTITYYLIEKTSIKIGYMLSNRVKSNNIIVVERVKV